MTSFNEATYTVPATQVVFIDEANTMLHITDASDIGLRAGQWPESIIVPGLGNGLPLFRTRGKVTNGDIEYVRYRQQFGCIDLDVYND